MRTGSARVCLELGPRPEVETFMRATRVEPVAQIRAQVRVFTSGEGSTTRLGVFSILGCSISLVSASTTWPTY